MARKSRKNSIGVRSPRNNIYWAAGYIRLSVTKDDQPSESIENQKRIIEQYIASQPDIIIDKYYVDAPANGTNFERKAFQEMLDDINSGKISCVVVKDLSRLGREYIEVGFYLEQYFPTRGVRFVSIGDRFDTIDGITNISFEKMSSMKIPITNIFNEKMVEDIRKKTQASIDVNIKEGRFVAPRAPYGYKKSPDDCYTLVPDQEAAAVVKDVFGMAAEKIGLNEIVRRLNATSIPTPIDYARENGLQGNYEQGNGFWNTRTVKYILTNRTYTGDLVQGKDSIIVQNTHEPLVSRDMFDIVQKLFDSSSVNANNMTNIPRSDNILRGKVICGSCGSKMQRRKGSGNADWHFFSCISNNRLGAGHCTGMYVRELDIVNMIRFEVARYVQENEIISASSQSQLTELTTKASDLERAIRNHNDNFHSYYVKFIEGITKVDDFVLVKEEGDRLRTEFSNVISQIEILSKEQEKFNLFCDVLQGSAPIEQLANAYLKEVIIHEGKRIVASLKSF